MSRIAIDIILLLPEKMNQLCIDINTSGFNHGKTTIQLGTDDFLPHISLVMGVIEETNLEALIQIIQSTSKKYQPLSLQAVESTEHTSFTIFQNQKLQELHEELMNLTSPFLLSESSYEDFFEGNSRTITEKVKNFITNFSKEHSYQNFQPHITLHTTSGEETKAEFQCDTIALNHVGISGTCRNIFFQTHLQ